MSRSVLNAYKRADQPPGLSVPCFSRHRSLPASATTGIPMTRGLGDAHWPADSRLYAQQLAVKTVTNHSSDSYSE
jgi:hypothetical protein